MNNFILNNETSDKEIYKMVHEIVDKAAEVEGATDPFFTSAAEIGLSAFLGLTKINAEASGKEATIEDFYKLYFMNKAKRQECENINDIFEEAAAMHPENRAVCLWPNFIDVSDRIKNSIYRIMDSAVDIAKAS